MNERLFTPLGMDRTFWFAQDAIYYSAAAGHSQLPGQEHPTIAKPWPIPRNAAAAGAAISNVEDVLKFVDIPHERRQDCRRRHLAGVSQGDAGAAATCHLADGVGHRLVAGRDRRPSHPLPRRGDERAHYPDVRHPGQELRDLSPHQQQQGWRGDWPDHRLGARTVLWSQAREASADRDVDGRPATLRRRVQAHAGRREGDSRGRQAQAGDDDQPSVVPRGDRLPAVVYRSDWERRVHRHRAGRRGLHHPVHRR